MSVNQITKTCTECKKPKAPDLFFSNKTVCKVCIFKNTKAPNEVKTTDISIQGASTAGSFALPFSVPVSLPPEFKLNLPPETPPGMEIFLNKVTLMALRIEALEKRLLQLNWLPTQKPNSKILDLALKDQLNSSMLDSYITPFIKS